MCSRNILRKCTNPEDRSKCYRWSFCHREICFIREGKLNCKSHCSRHKVIRSENVCNSSTTNSESRTETQPKYDSKKKTSSINNGRNCFSTVETPEQKDGNDNQEADIKKDIKKRIEEKSIIKPIQHTEIKSIIKSDPVENIPEGNKRQLILILNELSQEKNVNTWIGKIQKRSGDEANVSLIVYNYGRCLWARTGLSDTPELACVTYKNYNGIIVFPSSNLGNIYVSRVNEWYDIKGEGLDYSIEKLAYAIPQNENEFIVDSSRKGLIRLY
jgi:hypothetical protein